VATISFSKNLVFGEPAGEVFGDCTAPGRKTGMFDLVDAIRFVRPVEFGDSFDG